MVADAIEKAQATGLFDYIAVSSDDTDVLQIAVDYGVLPLWPSPATASDTATDDDGAAEVLRYFPKADIVCKLYPCIPLLPWWMIQRAMMVAEDFLSSFYTVDKNGKDAGAMNVFHVKQYQLGHSIALDKLQWHQINLLDENCQDINTPEDLEIAKKKAGL
jgi:CMP-N-acetylneuraminic acid synthetase